MTSSREPRIIDIATWARREQYELFRRFGYPYFSLTADVDVTALRESCRSAGASFTIGLVYAIARAANKTPAFRQRLRGEQVIEHEVVHPSITVRIDDDRFSFRNLPFQEPYAAFAREAAGRMEEARRSPSLWVEEDQDEFLYLTAIPWISFTAMVHPIPLDPPDSVPRIAWGKYRMQGSRVVMPLNIHVHHALIDGAHAGRFYELLQQELDAFSA